LRLTLLCCVADRRFSFRSWHNCVWHWQPHRKDRPKTRTPTAHGTTRNLTALPRDHAMIYPDDRSIGERPHRSICRGRR
jgi:hypothetical protein